jgi:hypothetical protein
MNTIEYQVGPPLFQWRRGGTIRCMVCQSSSVGRWLAFSFILVGACGRRGIEGFFRGGFMSPQQVFHLMKEEMQLQVWAMCDRTAVPHV